VPSWSGAPGASDGWPRAAFIDHALDHYGRIDALVNNAGSG
jgi:NAD(P)-dependent dehydrogenase (short-subunit alcohol dehydrogenase family)